MNKLTEDIIEQTALEYLASLGFDLVNGPDIAFDGITPERNVPSCPVRGRGWNHVG